MRAKPYGYPTAQNWGTPQQGGWPSSANYTYGDSYGPQRSAKPQRNRNFEDAGYDDAYGPSSRKGGYSTNPALDEMDAWSPSGKTQSRQPARPKAVGNDDYAEKAADTLYTILRHNPRLSTTLQETLGLTPDIMEEIQSTSHDPTLMRKRLFQLLADNPSGHKLQKALNSKWKEKLVKMAVQQATPDEYDKEVGRWLQEFKKTKPSPKPISYDPFSSLGYDSLY